MRLADGTAEFGSTRAPEPRDCERGYPMGGVRLAVYPTVTLLPYSTKHIDGPTFSMPLVTSVLAVPFTTLVVVPTVTRLIAEPGIRIEGRMAWPSRVARH